MNLYMITQHFDMGDGGTEHEYTLGEFPEEFSEKQVFEFVCKKFPHSSMKVFNGDVRAWKGNRVKAIVREKNIRYLDIEE